MKGFIVYPTYETIDEQTQILLFGKLENGQSFLTINKFNPYFFVRKIDLKHLPKIKIDTQETQLKSFQDDELVKLTFKNNTDLNNTHKKIDKEIPTYEADLKPHYRFLIENNLLGSIEIEGDYESSEKIDRIYKNPNIKPSVYTPKLNLISIDTESDRKGNLICAGIHSEKFHKTFMITDHKIKNVMPCKNEEECLKKFSSEIIKLDPDIITGWNFIDFDLVYLKELYKKHKIPFDIGRTNSEVKLRIESGFFRSSSADIEGRQALDGLNLIKDPFIKEAPTIKKAEFNSLTLEDVSQALLKKGKLIKGKNRHAEIEELYKKNTISSHQKLADYNLLDCQLAYEILEKNKIIELSIERSQLTGMPLDKLTGSISAFDSLYIREAHKKYLASPTMHYKQKEERITGGYVQSLSPGIYKNVLVLDFKSLYPSIIRTFNIDPSSYLEKKTKNSIETPNKAYFKNQSGILPIIIEKLHKAREQAKKENRELSNYAIKIIMNSFFGVLASPNCRYFNLKIGNSITHFGQFLIKLTAKEIEKEGFKVIYSDTDSVFVETKLEKTKANILGNKIQEDINKFYKSYVKKYNRESFLELEFEKQYLSLMIPQVRGKDKTIAAKKRYAGLIEKNNSEVLEIVGLEAIRGDWTDAAKEFQKEILTKTFHEEPIEKFIKSYIKKIREGKLDDKLIYKKSIRKNLKEYTKTTPPHVKAARKLPKLDSNIIKYYITTDGPEPIQLKKHKIDYDHYVEKQIKPIANQVLTLLNKDFDDSLKNSKQSKLF